MEKVINQATEPVSAPLWEQEQEEKITVAGGGWHQGAVSYWETSNMWFDWHLGENSLSGAALGLGSQRSHRMDPKLNGNMWLPRDFALLRL